MQDVEDIADEFSDTEPTEMPDKKNQYFHGIEYKLPLPKTENSHDGPNEREENGYRIKENYKNGKLHGKREIKYPAPIGKLWLKENYKNGLLDGYRNLWYVNGDRAVRELFSSGQLEERQIWGEGENISRHERYKNGVPDGEIKIWWDGGLGPLAELQSYKNGQKHGIWKEYGETGVLHLQNSYKDDQLDGMQIVYGKSGPIIEYYKEGREITGREYYDQEYKNFDEEKKLEIAEIGNQWGYIVMYNFLAKKYEHSCVFMPFTLTSEIDKDNLPAGFTNLYWVCDAEMKCAFRLPEVFTQKGKKSNEEAYRNFREFLRECIEKSSRLSIISLGLTSPVEGGHANMLVFDKKLRTLERFEPNGQANFAGYNSKELDEKIPQFFADALGKFTYFPPESYCPKLGPQSVAYLSQLKVGSKFSGGFCSTWSFVYAYYRLKFPDRTREEIINTMIHGIQQKEEPYYFIRKIALELDELGHKISLSKNTEEIHALLLSSTLDF